MHLKRFRAATVRDALAEARNELGDQALVLSTALVPVRGWRGLMGGRHVEVTVGVDREVSANRPAEREVRHEAPTAGVVARLCAAGFDRRTADEVAGRLTPGRRRSASTRLTASLAQQFAGLTLGDEDCVPVEAFIGPAGAGKTTTIAKLAAQRRAQDGARLGLVAADGYRVGAIEQLRLYADIIGVPFVVARSPRDVEDAIRTSRTPVLVDTAGRSPEDGAARELFAVLARTRGVRTHLVIPAGVAADDFKRIFDAHAAARPQRIVLTKIDDAGSPAVLARVLQDVRLPISYLSAGQRVPEDLSRATPASLASMMLGDLCGPAESAA